jgi:23S rRNA (cytidine1920-2'-O)/16S rRNA (cytidine1409-2'-O)-methyltransferase
VDVGFISLKLVLPAIGALLKQRAILVALIKPQFETKRSAIKKGVVRNPSIHTAICDDIAAFLGSLSWRVVGIMSSPIFGGNGNREFLIEAERG